MRVKAVRPIYLPKVGQASPTRRAMTLVEVLVASVVLGVGVTGLISAAALSLRNQQRTEHRAAALYIAQEKLAAVDLIGAHAWAMGQETQGQETYGGVNYEWAIQIDQLSVGQLFSVNAKVKWLSGTGSRTVELETWLNDYKAVSLTAPEQHDKGGPLDVSMQ